jgi:hypothetical protein
MDASKSSCEPSVPGGSQQNAWLWTANTAFNTYGTPIDIEASGTRRIATSLTLSTYNNGDRFRDKIAFWDTTAGNGAFQSIVIGGDSGAEQGGIRQLMTSSQTKDSDHTLTCTFRIAWDRVLTN